MISYEAFDKEEVVIKASEIVTDFAKSTDWRLTHGPEDTGEYKDCRIWQYRLDPALFCGYNPFCCVNILHDRLFIEYDKTDMTPYLNRRGMIFCDGKPLKQAALYHQMSDMPGSYWVEANFVKGLITDHAGRIHTSLHRPHAFPVRSAVDKYAGTGYSGLRRSLNRQKRSPGTAIIFIIRKRMFLIYMKLFVIYLLFLPKCK